MKPMNEETIASLAATAADDLAAIIEPLDKLLSTLRRVSSTQIAGSDEQIRILNQTGAPGFHKIIREFRKHPRMKKLRSAVADVRPALEEMLEALPAIEKAMRGE